MNRKHYADLIRVLRAFTRTPEYGGWAAELLGEGKQAWVYRVRRRNGDAAWGDHAELAVKLYKPTEPEAPRAARGEFETLSELSRTVAGAEFHGWRISTPTPLYFCPRRLGVVMTCAAGHSVVRSLGQDPDAVADPTFAAAVLCALQQFWAGTQRLYGDLNFSNILIDRDSRTLCFLDPGSPEICYACDGIPDRFGPASRDLAYLLFESAAAVRAHLAEPHVRTTLVRLSRQLLQGHLSSLASSERSAFEHEVRSCATFHVGRIKVGWSPSGLWRRLVRRISVSTVRRTLDSLNASSRDTVSAWTDPSLSPCLPN